MSNIIWIIVIGFVAGLIARFVSPGPNGPSGFILTTVLGIVGAFVGPAHRLVSTRSGRGSYRRDRWRSDRVVYLEQACGPPCYRRSGRGNAGPPAIVKPDAHECLNNMMAKASLLIIIELGPYRSKTWD